VTKYRRSVFRQESLSVIEESFKEVARKMDFQILEFNGEADHIHAVN
jgi:putative transposase